MSSRVRGQTCLPSLSALTLTPPPTGARAERRPGRHRQLDLRWASCLIFPGSQCSLAKEKTCEPGAGVATSTWGRGRVLLWAWCRSRPPSRVTVGHSLYLWAQTFSSAQGGPGEITKALLVPGAQRRNLRWTKCQFWRARTSFHPTAGKFGEEVGGLGFLAVQWP